MIFKKINGSVNFDPISKLLRTGAFYQSENDDFASCSDIIKASHYLPHFRVLSVDAVLFKMPVHPQSKSWLSVLPMVMNTYKE